MAKACALEDCERPVDSGRHCETHRRRIRRHGDPHVVKRLWKASRAERLERYVDRSAGPDACWPWTGARTATGYGRVANRDGGTAVASRAAYEVAHNVTLVRSQVVMHLCDNPPCCNPAHLRAGSMAENQAHMAWAQRSASGAANGNARLTTEQVTEMRARRAGGTKLTGLAEAYGVSVAQVSRICSGTRWAAITAAATSG